MVIGESIFGVVVVGSPGWAAAGSGVLINIISLRKKGAFYQEPRISNGALEVSTKMASKLASAKTLLSLTY